MPVNLSGHQLTIEFSYPVYIIGSMIVVLLFALMFITSLCYFALKNSTVSGIRAMFENETPSAEKAVCIKNESSKHIDRLKTAVIFQATAITGISFALYSIPLAGAFYSVYQNSILSMCLSVLILLVVLSVLILIFAYMLPGRITLDSSDRLMLKTRCVTVVLSTVFAPLSVVGKGLNYLLCHLFIHSDKHSPPSNDNPTEEKILMMVDEGEENGTIEENTKSMIENVFDFDDTTVGEIMTHRKDVIAVKDDDTLTTLKETAIKSGRSRIPVYHDDIDDIVGIIYVKDLLPFIEKKDFSDKIDNSIIHDAIYVPESKRCSEMFEYMTSHKTQIAVVVDEFGGTGGIITMEDLIESILGNIQDEYDNEDDSIRKVNEYSFQVDGATSLDEIEELTGISFEEDENDTIAGIMLDRMGHIPKSGEHPSIMINGTRFTVLEVEGRRISRILVVKHHKDAVEKKQ